MIVRLSPRQTAVVGYGSLMSRESVGKTLGRAYDGVFGRCHVQGWRRSWDVAMPNAAFYFTAGDRSIYPAKIAYLNVRPSPGTLMNAVLFVVDAGELEAMHEREWIYEPRIVTGSLRDIGVEGGDAVMYVGAPDYVVGDTGDPADVAIRASYLRILEQALAATDAAFRGEYERTTDPVPAHLVIDDRLDRDRPNPWARAGMKYRP